MKKIPLKTDRNRGKSNLKFKI